MSANATRRQLSAITDFGSSLGLAFQVIDDILDVTQTTEKLGKSAGKDVTAKKATYPAVIGLENLGAKRGGSHSARMNRSRFLARKPMSCVRSRPTFSNANTDSGYTSRRFGSISSRRSRQSPLKTQVGRKPNHDRVVGR